MLKTLTIAVLLSTSALAAAQPHDGHGTAAPSASQPGPHAAHRDTNPPTDPHVGHDMPAMQNDEHAGHQMPTAPEEEHQGHDMSQSGHAGHNMGSATGRFPMTRDGSGTSWQPDAAPMMGIMGSVGDWSTMLHGNTTLVHSNQGGPRGDTKTFVSSMVMGMAQRPLGAGKLTLKGMASLDPLMGKSGYPLLFATGETADGLTELVDRQHPHDFLAELSATITQPLGSDLDGFVYLALPGEPALGPTTYLHRFAGMASPEAPIAHHWMDSTHVTFGVATVGLAGQRWKLESSLFTGREPDEKRWNIEKPRFDSWSVRATVNPTANWSLQISHGRLKSPEGLHPDEDVRRTTGSATFHQAWADDRRFESTFAWGRNKPVGGDEDHHAQATDAFTLDGALQLGRNTFFARGERVEKDELFVNEPANPLHDEVFTINKLSIGAYHAIRVGHLSLDLGGLVSKYRYSDRLDADYGKDPTSFMLFSRLRLGR